MYEKDTGRVVIMEMHENEDSHWVIPDCWDLSTFPAGTEPVLIEGKDGSVYLSPNKTILLPEYFDE